MTKRPQSLLEMSKENRKIFSFIFVVAVIIVGACHPQGDQKNKTILVTGGTGYIGSHVLVELANKDF